jgi:hypothetical protein
MDMRINRLQKEWWTCPTLRHNKFSIPAAARRGAVEDFTPVPKLKGKTGAFAPSNRWVYYNRLQRVDVNYIVPMYDLKAIGKRFGLSQNGQIYFKKHILPDPFTILRRRSVASHHWSHFTLSVMDLVLRDLEKRGYSQFLKSFEEHIDLLHTGVEYLEDYYGAKQENTVITQSDTFGVSWGG